VLLHINELRNYGIGHFEVKKRNNNHEMNHLLNHEKKSLFGKQDGENF
jgi:hypothetical protein